MKKLRLFCCCGYLSRRNVKPKSPYFDYSEIAYANVQKILKGELPKTVKLYGGELVGCAQINFPIGRHLVFLRHDQGFLVGCNWHLGVCPIKNTQIEWYASSKGFKLSWQPLNVVLEHIESSLKKVQSQIGKRIHMNKAYGIAIICGIFPLLLGISIFLLWLTTRWSWLILAGVFTIWSGVVIVFIGLISLLCFCWLNFRTPTLPRRRLWFLTLGCAALLTSNFIVASGIITAVINVLFYNP